MRLRTAQTTCRKVNNPLSGILVLEEMVADVVGGDMGLWSLWKADLAVDSERASSINTVLALENKRVKDKVRKKLLPGPS